MSNLAAAVRKFMEDEVTGQLLIAEFVRTNRPSGRGKQRRTVSEHLLNELMSVSGQKRESAQRMIQRWVTQAKEKRGTKKGVSLQTRAWLERALGRRRPPDRRRPFATIHYEGYVQISEEKEGPPQPKRNVTVGPLDLIEMLGLLNVIRAAEQAKTWLYTSGETADAVFTGYWFEERTQDIVIDGEHVAWLPFLEDWVAYTDGEFTIAPAQGARAVA